MKLSKGFAYLIFGSMFLLGGSFFVAILTILTLNIIVAIGGLALVYCCSLAFIVQVMKAIKEETSVGEK